MEAWINGQPIKLTSFDVDARIDVDSDFIRMIEQLPEITFTTTLVDGETHMREMQRQAIRTIGGGMSDN